MRWQNISLLFFPMNGPWRNGSVSWTTWKLVLFFRACERVSIDGKISGLSSTFDLFDWVVAASSPTITDFGPDSPNFEHINLGLVEIKKSKVLGIWRKGSWYRHKIATYNRISFCRVSTTSVLYTFENGSEDLNGEIRGREMIISEMKIKRCLVNYPVPKCRRFNHVWGKIQKKLQRKSKEYVCLFPHPTSFPCNELLVAI